MKHQPHRQIPQLLCSFSQQEDPKATLPGARCSSSPCPNPHLGVGGRRRGCCCGRGDAGGSRRYPSELALSFRRLFPNQQIQLLGFYFL